MRRKQKKKGCEEHRQRKDEKKTEKERKEKKEKKKIKVWDKKKCEGRC